jgi:ATP-dependent Zn protease
MRLSERKNPVIEASSGDREEMMAPTAKRTKRRPRRAAEELRHTAHHEAGHAVIARVLTLVAGHATIKPDYDEGTAGVSVTHESYACLSEWEKRGKVRELDAVWHARIMTAMAGAEAEAVLLGRKSTGDDDDQYQILLMAEELCRSVPWKRLELRLRAMTRMLVQRHKARIERVAKALLARTTLNAEQLNELVGRSVADVKVNAPLLLGMHRLAEPSASRRASASAPIGRRRGPLNLP